ncbi:MAG: peptide chain release factor N(5)-glutamine methyltransferase, partial [Saprospiraceae bacterium]|nr:peptide chain release factor N(5)-glutamine methyltransferase [Saprospiraceae bacterium]
MVQSLSEYYGQGEAHSISRIVFEDAFQLYSFSSLKDFPPKYASLYQEILQRLLKKEPVQYILGQADFYGLKFKVSPATLIPRQETEELVYWIIETCKQKNLTNAEVLDIGTGTGCIPITLKVKLNTFYAKGLDVSEKAIEVARQNAVLNRVEVAFKKADILNRKNWQELGEYDLIVSNPPYIPNKEQSLMPEHVLGYEPGLALFVEDDDPLIFYKAVTDFAKAHLRANGWLFFE